MFSVPVQQFLTRALMPLHKPKCVAMYHQQLAYCVTQVRAEGEGIAEFRQAGRHMAVEMRGWPSWNCCGCKNSEPPPPPRAAAAHQQHSAVHHTHTAAPVPPLPLYQTAVCGEGPQAGRACAAAAAQVLSRLSPAAPTRAVACFPGLPWYLFCTL
jgi:hypothetical protein